jgi:hypothetical protein
MCWHRLKRFQHPSLCSGPHSLRLCVQGQSTGLTLVEPESRFSSQPAHQKQQSHRKGGFVVLWWWNTEPNPNPLLGIELTVANAYIHTAGWIPSALLQHGRCIFTA